MEKKRRPIRNRVRLIMILITTATLLVAGVIGLVSMFTIQNLSEEVITDQMKKNMTDIVEGRCKIVEAELERYSFHAEEFADFISRTYSSPDDYQPVTIPPLDPANGGKLVLQLSEREKGIDVYEEKIYHEASMVGNMKYILDPVIAKEKEILTIYVGSESGFLLGYDKNSDLFDMEDTSYDYSSSSWYKPAIKAGGAYFTDAYTDSFGRGLTITCAAPFYDAGGSVAGVLGIDFLIGDMYEEVISAELDEGAYVFLVDGNGNVISPDSEALPLTESEMVSEGTKAEILSGKTGVTLDDNGVYYAYCPVNGVNWILCTHMPQELVLKPVHEMDRLILASVVFFVIFLFITLAIAMYAAQRLSKSITDPIIELGNDALKISGGNLDYRAKIRQNDELGDLAGRFNEMADSLKQHIADLTSMTAEKERMGAELDVAARIQSDMLPSVFPAFPDRKEFDIYATMSPAREVGGDFYDFFLIDGNRLALVIADVSGKGVPAALFMVTAMTLIKNNSLISDSPAAVLEEVNKELCAKNKEQLFVTVWLGFLDIVTGKMIYSNAGHEYPAIKSGNDDYTIMEFENDPPLAAMEAMAYENMTVMMKPGDSIFLYTDGVPEAKNEKGERFGMDRMMAVMKENEKGDPKEQVEVIKKAVYDFTGNAEQFDDITLLELSYYGSR